jgi:hypothetical protein
MVGTVVTRGFEGVDHNGISRELALGSLDIQTLDISSRRELPAIFTALWELRYFADAGLLVVLRSVLLPWSIR